MSHAAPPMAIAPASAMPKDRARTPKLAPLDANGVMRAMLKLKGLVLSTAPVCQSPTSRAPAAAAPIHGAARPSTLDASPEASSSGSPRSAAVRVVDTLRYEA